MSHDDLSAPVLLWLRRELRVEDNPALHAALATKRPIIPVYVLDDETPGAWALGGASRWWLHHSLAELSAAIAQRGSRLVLARGAIASVIPNLVAETGAAAVHAGIPVEPWARRAMKDLAAKLAVPLHTHRTTLLFEPGTVRTQAGGPYGVFTPFSRACLARGTPEAPLQAPSRIPAPATAPRSDRLEDWRLLPTKPDWAGGLRDTWKPGETAAHERLAAFIGGAVGSYGDTRNLPGVDGTSMLSAHLHFGELSPAQVWHASDGAPETPGRVTYRNELLWREFSANLLWHRPDLPEAPLRPEFGRMPSRSDAADLHAWQRGRTGIPIVDAGMRQLWQLGWMHNRVRMIAASFLVKHLLLPWQEGEAWFWDTLVDADLATNAASWQWVAGCGADAAPFFRVFNPVLQGRKFDPGGEYVRRFVPELAKLPDKHLHAPWEAPPMVLQTAGIVLGQHYPKPVVDLGEGRSRALAAFARISRSAA